MYHFRAPKVGGGERNSIAPPPSHIAREDISIFENCTWDDDERRRRWAAVRNVKTSGDISKIVFNFEFSIKFSKNITYSFKNMFLKIDISSSSMAISYFVFSHPNKMLSLFVCWEGRVIFSHI